MGTKTPSDAVVYPQSRGTGTTDNFDSISAAASSLLASHSHGEYVKDGLTFANVDSSANQVDVTKGVCYIEDTSASTANSRGAGGNAQIQSSSTSGFDAEIPTGQVYLVVIPTDITNLDLDSGVNDIYVSVDVTTQNSVTVHGTGGSAPTAPYMKLGTVDVTLGSSTEMNRHPQVLETQDDGTTLYPGTATINFDTSTGIVITDNGNEEITVGSSSGPGGFSQNTITSDTTASNADSLWVDASSAAVTVTLPGAPSSSDTVRVVAVDATNTVAVDPNGNNINGAASNRTLVQDVSETYESDGTNWWVV